VSVDNQFREEKEIDKSWVEWDKNFVEDDAILRHVRIIMIIIASSTRRRHCHHHRHCHHRHHCHHRRHRLASAIEF
jgi:hypothetical protein